MSKDIRSFFKVISSKPGASTKGNSPDTKPKKKRVLIDSDSDEDVVKDTPEQKKPKKPTAHKRKVVVINSDSEDEHKKNSKSPSKKEKGSKSTPERPKLKPVNIADVFKNTPISQKKVEYVSPAKLPETEDKAKPKAKRKQKKNTEVGIHDDPDFEKTLLELDDETFTENMDFLDKTVEDALQREKEASKEEKRSDKTMSTETQKKRKNSGSMDTPSKKPKIEHTDSGIDPDEERYEKKRYSAMLYQKYKNRGGPKHHGSKELPKGKPDCLKNLTFLRTGVLDSLDSDEFEHLIKEHRGRVVHTVSKKVDYIVVGDDPGPSKLEKARGYKIPEISEDDLLDMILVKSGEKPKFSKMDSEDTGIGTGSEESSPKSEKSSTKVDEKPKVKVEKSLSKPHQKSEDKKSDIKIEKSSSKPNLNKLLGEEPKSISANIKKEPPSPSQSKKNKDKPKETKIPKDEPKQLTKISKSEDLPQIQRPKTETGNSSMAWTEKYKPKSTKDIIGQQEPNSNVNKLKKWLQKWEWNQKPEVRSRLPKPTPWNQFDGSYFKVALLSGPPGVGKTTTATLVAKELGYDVVELNASDTRSKKLLQQEVSQLLHTNTIAGFAAGDKKTGKKRVLLMDEVDGIAGNEDRGGIGELISLIKTSSIPIICMCNDRSHQKMRTLVTYCYDLKFTKPNIQKVKGALLSLCFKEGLQVTPDVLSELIVGTGCDIRQTLNHLFMWSAADKNLSAETVQKESKSSQKNVVFGPWEVVKKVFNESEQKNMSLSDKSRLFFFDYSFGPLFVQENYLNVVPHCKSNEALQRAYQAADSLSMGDIIESKIRGTNNWSLLESQAFYSSVFPGYYMSGHLEKVNFPSWLGKNSKKNKLKRMLGELYTHTRTRISGSILAMKLDYITPLRNAIIGPLKTKGTEGVHEAIEVMKCYYLLREDLNNLVELCHWPETKNPFDEIEPKVKAAFTRAYNKEGPLLPFALPAVSSKKKAAVEEDPYAEEEAVESDTEEKDDITGDSMIKVKAAKGKKDTSKAKDSKPGASKAARGRGKKK